MKHHHVTFSSFFIWSTFQYPDALLKQVSSWSGGLWKEHIHLSIENGLLGPPLLVQTLWWSEPPFELFFSMKYPAISEFWSSFSYSTRAVLKVLQTFQTVSPMCKTPPGPLTKRARWRALVLPPPELRKDFRRRHRLAPREGRFQRDHGIQAEALGWDRRFPKICTCGAAGPFFGASLSCGDVSKSLVNVPVLVEGNIPTPPRSCS